METFSDVPDIGEPDEQPEVEENEEILVPEQVLAQKVTKKGKARRQFLIKFKNFPAFDAKWMDEEDLADAPQILKLYLEAFGVIEGDYNVFKRGVCHKMMTWQVTIGPPNADVAVFVISGWQLLSFLVISFSVIGFWGSAFQALPSDIFGVLWTISDLECPSLLHVVCQKTKFDRGKQPGLLQPLPIPDSPWESISMDFIFGLPKSIHGNTGIWTIVDRFSKQAHFLPVKKTIKAHQMATLFISQIFKYHGLPTSIVSDRDPRMTSNFWKGLFENLGTRLNFSSAYHPQTDGQSEIANLTILDLLKSYVTEVDQRSQWEKYLPLVEYAYNNTVHTSTGKAPFEVIEGRPKSPLLLKVHGKIFAADEYSRDLKESFQKIKEAISISQQKQKAAANKHRRALAFKENDWVLLKFPKARLRHTSAKNHTGHQKYYAKLAKRYYGPFQILKPINEMAYQLKLPNHWLIHNAFHVSLLKPYKGEPPSEAITEDPPEVEDQEEVLQPESILRHEDKVLRHGKTIRRYLIKFKNYPFEDARWMQGIQLKDSLHLVNAYNDSLE
ncbi:hypothetical protein L7F22_055733 [Adiantum nelumboides]|nr:hypothetical protein [Adiantum nelumboides]